jgi:hypothetical protein
VSRLSAVVALIVAEAQAAGARMAQAASSRAGRFARKVDLAQAEASLS